MSKEPVVSVIMPVYNAQKYILKCIQSVILQSFEDWELVLVDDGSTDATPEICDWYAKQDARISVIHKKNSGVSVARNEGIRLSKGRYIVFADGDDMLPRDSLKVRVDLMKDADMGIGGYEIIDSCNDLIERMPPCVTSHWGQKEAMNHIVVAGQLGYQGYLWNKIFLRDCMVAHQIYFQEDISYNEDRLFVVQYMMHCRNVHLGDEIVYQYRKNPDGAMGALSSMKDSNYGKIMSEFKAFQIICHMMKQYDRKLYDACALEAMDRAVDLNRRMNGRQILLRQGLRQMIRKFGLWAIAGQPLKKKVMILGHVILKK